MWRQLFHLLESGLALTFDQQNMVEGMLPEFWASCCVALSRHEKNSRLLQWTSTEAPSWAPRPSRGDVNPAAHGLQLPQTPSENRAAEPTEPTELGLTTRDCCF